MTDKINNEIFDNIRLAELNYIEKDIEGIICGIDFATEEDELLCRDIILNLELTAAEEIKNDKCVQLPFIGSIRKNPLKKVLDENRTAFRLARKNLNDDDFKAYCAETFQNKKDKLRLEDYRKAKIKEIRNKYKTRYEQYVTHLGPAYANMFLNAILMMRMVEFDQEFEDTYNRLRNE